MAERLGWPVHDVYEDNDTSAWSGRRRPEYERLCADIKAGIIDGLVVWHNDRLHRHPRELEDLISLIEAAGEFPIKTAVSGDFDLNTSAGRTSARILGAVARKESDDKSLRLLSKHAELANKGKVSGGGTRPYGYTQDRLHVVPEEAAVIREATVRVLGGESLRSVCADLNDRGFATSVGKPWTIGSLSRVLRSARISGRREHRGEIVAVAEWSGIISPADSDRLRSLGGRGGGPGPTGRSPRTYLLTGGLVRCGRCGTPMVSKRRTDGTRRYVCASGPGLGGCGRMAVNAEPVESFIAQSVLFRLDTPELAAALTEVRHADTETDHLAAALAEDQAMLAQVTKDYTDKAISHDAWITAQRLVQARVDATKRRLSRISPTGRIDEYAGRSEALGEAWADLPLSRQQAIVRAVVDHVVVNPATQGRNRFDSERLGLIWRL